MQSGRGLLALWIVCAGVIAWVWLRPLHDGVLPAPVEHAPRKPRLTAATHALAAPDDEPAAEEPVAEPVRGGIPEALDRQDLESTIGKVRAKVLACRDVEQFTGFLTVKMTIARSGNLQSVAVEPPADKTRTGDCVRKALHGLSFPKFRGTYLPTIEWTYPFLFKDGA